jgi:phenylpropionate dioxygenase-like ring-hydroxylating dioxygenase large terminal subunit
MLSTADNELLVRVGRGTPLNELHRRFWTPVMLASELGGADSPPVRVHVLDEQLVAFRDTSGAIGLLSAYSPHRRANLFWGRNEEHGLRCAYHGWKFDRTGQCVDMPNCPEGPTLKDRVRTNGYPTLERGGLVWAYLGPPELEPPFPHMELFELPSEQVYTTKMLPLGNYLQLQEGDVDSSHVSLLHSSIDGSQIATVDSATFDDHAPRWFPTETSYGLMLGAQRDAGDDAYHWRVNQWLMPYVTLIAITPGFPMLAHVRVPIDDTHTLHFRVNGRADGPFTDADRALFANNVMVPELMPGTFHTVENIENDYLIDRSAQKTRSFSGIRSVVAQDLAVTQDQAGPVSDRSREYLTTSDRAIIMLRRRILRRVRELQAGGEPPEVRVPEAYGVRPGDFKLPRDIGLEEAAKERLTSPERSSPTRSRADR